MPTRTIRCTSLTVYPTHSRRPLLTAGKSSRNVEPGVRTGLGEFEHNMGICYNCSLSLSLKTEQFYLQKEISTVIYSRRDGFTGILLKTFFNKDEVSKDTYFSKGEEWNEYFV